MKHKFSVYNSICILFIFFIVFFNSCKEQEFTNPWDEKANLSPDEWMPKNLTIEDVSITEKKLTWTYEDKNIEGFKIERRVNNGGWESLFPIFNKELKSFTDTTVLPDTSLTYEYRLYAVAGNNQSNEETKAIKILFPAPSNLSIVINGETTATLT